MKKLISTLVLIFTALFLVGCSCTTTTTTTDTADTAGKTSSNQSSTPATSEEAVLANEVLALETFSSGLGAWYEETWYAKKSSGGEVVASDDGLTFKGVQSNSRSGVMLDLNRDVSEFEKLNLKVIIEADIQTLEGTGFQGREAPVAIAVSYQGVDGSEHTSLGEDPNAAGQMFWRGFYYLDPTGDQSGIINGVKVSQGQPYTFKFDLMSLNPKPQKIYFVALEGAGWKEREGKVSSISIVGEK
ncbi:MAG: hypothetical protein WC604_00765 [Candidatus Gracilibacteria bacterium]